MQRVVFLACPSQAGIKLPNYVWSVVRQKNSRDDQGESVQDSGKTGTGVRGAKRHGH